MESLEGDRRRRLVVHVVEVPPGIAPAGEFDQRGITERGCPVIELSTSTIAISMQEPTVGAEQGLADPIGECRAVKLDPFAEADPRLAVQRDVAAEFRYDDMGN